MHWVAPSGLVGVTPLAAVGPVSVGPGPAERSSASLPRVLVRVDPLQSLLQKKLVLSFRADQAQVRAFLSDVVHGLDPSLHLL